MPLIRQVVFTILCVAYLQVVEASAGLVSLNFEVDVDHVGDEHGILPGIGLGSAFAGTVTYNTNVSGDGYSNIQSYLYGPVAPAGMSVLIDLEDGLYVFEHVFQFNNMSRIVVQNDNLAGFGGLSDKIDIKSRDFEQTGGASVGDILNPFFSLELSSSNLSTLANTLLPTAGTFPQLAMFDEQNDTFFTFDQASTGAVSVQGHLSSVTVVVAACDFNVDLL